jgi:hypothetical protein
VYYLPPFKANNPKVGVYFTYQYPFIILCGVDENNELLMTNILVLIQGRN